MGEKERNWAEVWGSEEWAWIKRLGSAITDPEEKRVFWDTIKQRKEDNPKYSIFSDFPKGEKEVRKERTETERAREEFFLWWNSRRAKKDESA